MSICSEYEGKQQGVHGVWHYNPNLPTYKPRKVGNIMQVETVKYMHARYQKNVLNWQSDLAGGKIKVTGPKPEMTKREIIKTKAKKPDGVPNDAYFLPSEEWLTEDVDDCKNARIQFGKEIVMAAKAQGKEVWRPTTNAAVNGQLPGYTKYELGVDQPSRDKMQALLAMSGDKMVS